MSNTNCWKYLGNKSVRVYHILLLIMMVCLSMYTNHQKLVVDGDVESNPGPNFKTQKIISGTFSQGDVIRFGETAGIQCCSNSLVAICWSTIKRVGIWKSWDLDNILIQGNNLHRTIGKERSLELNELPDVVTICNRPLSVAKLGNDYGFLSTLLGNY